MSDDYQRPRPRRSTAAATQENLVMRHASAGMAGSSLAGGMVHACWQGCMRCVGAAHIHTVCVVPSMSGSHLAVYHHPLQAPPVQHLVVQTLITWNLIPMYQPPSKQFAPLARTSLHTRVHLRPRVEACYGKVDKATASRHFLAGCGWSPCCMHAAACHARHPRVLLPVFCCGLGLDLHWRRLLDRAISGGT